MNLLERLWILADEVAASGQPKTTLFGECGLFLERPLVRYEYFCTPLNSLTFASTGGDGVHYGFLLFDDVAYDELPVIMTVPMSDRRNIVVAESLKEFLGLGFYVGWFCLEQLVYDASWAIAYFRDGEPEMSDEKQEQLNLLRERLQIRYVPLSIERIENLNDKYLPLLRLPSPE